MEHFFSLFTVWLAYGLLHSALASSQVKSFVQQTFSWSAQRYRLLFVIIAILSLLPALYIHLISPSIALWENSSFQKLAGAAMATSGLFIIKRAFQAYDLKQFVGLAQEEPNDILITTGYLSKVRHPLYSGTLLFFYGWFLFSNTNCNLALAIAMHAYTLIGIHWEEKKLIAKFGKAYKDYMEKVPALIPKKLN
ncbi:Protein-S-isoprenylcysteine O-methyltransferase Ste14 [Spirosomataceae bacterium TFI 002]|nr:Protein-S-isoprenylcysteine O-methyltransferase Ste14 [Spirosomataceae bacterium TFI 002]